MQAVGPMESETVTFKGLKRNRERIKVPIPKTVNEEGGTFQVDLVSVKDSYGCKKSLAVPGTSVNVRRVKVIVSSSAIAGSRLNVVISQQLASTLRMLVVRRRSWKVTKLVFPCDLKAKE